MEKTKQKKNRILDIFYRAMKGEFLVVKKLAEEYGVPEKSICADMREIETFLYENEEVFGDAEWMYSSDSESCYLEYEKIGERFKNELEDRAFMEGYCYAIQLLEDSLINKKFNKNKKNM